MRYDSRSINFNCNHSGSSHICLFLSAFLWGSVFLIFSPCTCLTSINLNSLNQLWNFEWLYLPAYALARCDNILISS
jgi:hypothetical protein